MMCKRMANSDGAVVRGAPPRTSPLILVIGELENRVVTVPATFSSENLDMRHRLPDRKVKELDRFGRHQPD